MIFPDFIFYLFCHKKIYAVALTTFRGELVGEGGGGAQCTLNLAIFPMSESEGFKGTEQILPLRQTIFWKEHET